MKKISIFLVASIFLLGTIFTSCEAVKNTNKTQRGAAIGAVGGALIGGILGNIIDIVSLHQPLSNHCPNRAQSKKIL